MFREVGVAPACVARDFSRFPAPYVVKVLEFMLAKVVAVNVLRPLHWSSAGLARLSGSGHCSNQSHNSTVVDYRAGDGNRTHLIFVGNEAPHQSVSPAKSSSVLARADDTTVFIEDRYSQGARSRLSHAKPDFLCLARRPPSSWRNYGRSDRIRTCIFMLPKHVGHRYPTLRCL